MSGVDTAHCVSYKRLAPCPELYNDTVPMPRDSRTVLSALRSEPVSAEPEGQSEELYVVSSKIIWLKTKLPALYHCDLFVVTQSRDELFFFSVFPEIS